MNLKSNPHFFNKLLNTNKNTVLARCFFHQKIKFTIFYKTTVLAIITKSEVTRTVIFERRLD